MRLPLILAHGEQILVFILVIGAVAITASISALVAACARKKKDSVSIFGIVGSVIGIIVGALLWFMHRGGLPLFDLFSIVMLLPLPLALVALYFSLRRKERMPIQSATDNDGAPPRRV